MQPNAVSCLQKINLLYAIVSLRRTRTRVVKRDIILKERAPLLVIAAPTIP